jgi:predicted RND superfamily exporter protein
MNTFKTGPLKRLVRFNLRHYREILGVTIILTVLSFFILAHIKTNFSIKAFVVPGNEVDKKLQEYHSHFNKPESEIMLLLIHIPEGLNCNNIDNVLAFCKALKELKGHYGLLSLAEMPVTYDINEEESTISNFETLYRETGC